jgi:hypothetical protein
MWNVLCGGGGPAAAPPRPPFTPFPALLVPHPPARHRVTARGREAVPSLPTPSPTLFFMMHDVPSRLVTDRRIVFGLRSFFPPPLPFSLQLRWRLIALAPVPFFVCVACPCRWLRNGGCGVVQ